MKTLITALAIAAMLAIPAMAKTEHTRATHIHPNHVVSHNSASHNPVTQTNSDCRFAHGETDPDPESVSSFSTTAKPTKAIPPGNPRGVVIDHAAIFLSSRSRFSIAEIRSSA
jgi:hypothetical protein